MLDIDRLEEYMYNLYDKFHCLPADIREFTKLIEQYELAVDLWNNPEKYDFSEDNTMTIEDFNNIRYCGKGYKKSIYEVIRDIPRMYRVNGNFDEPSQLRKDDLVPSETPGHTIHNLGLNHDIITFAKNYFFLLETNFTPIIGSRTALIKDGKIVCPRVVSIDIKIPGDQKTLEGSPKIIYGSFGTGCCFAKNLIGGPEIVYGTYDASSGWLESLEGAPNHIAANFKINNNPKLLSFDYMPKHIGGEIIADLKPILTLSESERLSLKFKYSSINPIDLLALKDK